MRLVVLLVFATACGRFGFDPNSSSPPADASLPAHVTEVPLEPTASIELATTAVIDTSALAIDGAAPPAGTGFIAVAQAGGGPDLALLVVDEFSIASGVGVRVVGERPLVIFARGAITIGGVLDGGARGAEPGPGGALPGAGAGAGGALGKPTADVCDPGGGGGGGGTAGAPGGSEECAQTFGAAGAVDSDVDLAILDGGSGGGSGSPGECPAAGPGGAGGGAVQLTSLTALAIGSIGSIVVGGGGGSGGRFCNLNDAGAGSGGGSGGAIFLEAPSFDIQNANALAISGGGGGAGGNGNATNGPVGNGEDGADGATFPGAGGDASGVATSGNGGNGGSTTSPPTPGGAASFNPGGGGGAVGRAVQRERSI